MEEASTTRCDSITIGTGATGSVKVYFDADKEPEEKILDKADLCYRVWSKLTVAISQQKARF